MFRLLSSKIRKSKKDGIIKNNVFMNKKVYISGGTLQSGGAERVISLLSSSFVDVFSVVKILMWIDAPIFYHLDKRIEIISIEKECHSKNNLKKMMWVRNFVLNNKPDAFLSFLTPFSLLSITSLVGIKCNIIVAERNDPAYLRGGYLMKKIRNFLFRRTSGILVQTANNKEGYNKYLRRKISVIYNPVFMSPETRGTALNKESKKEIVSVARLHSQKNIPMMLRAFKEFYKRHPDYKLIIYGEGCERVQLEEMIQKEGLALCVTMPGVRKDIFNEISCAKMFVLSSDYEGMPNALIEALCLGLPCISTKVSGAVDLIENGKNGILVEKGDFIAMSNAMEQVANDDDLARRLAKQAVSIYDKLEVSQISKQWVDYLQRSMEMCF